MTLPYIKLFGDPVENFYQLGLKDQGNFLPLYQHIIKLASPKVPVLPEVLEEIAKKFVATKFYKNNEKNQLIRAYAEGLNRPFSEVALCTLMPEFLSSMGKWLPELPEKLLGCSSFFFWDEDRNCPGHTRVLDFPLIETFDQNERLISYDLLNESKILSFSTAGIPFPAITAMNEYGVSFALHQKFTDLFDPDGTPIFELSYELLKQAKDLKSTIDFLKKSKSVTTWCILLSFPNGDVLAADISGENLSYKTHKLKHGEIFYYNNTPFDEKWLSKAQIPTGILHYNNMRDESANKKINSLKKEKINALKVHKTVCSPLASKNVKKWNMDVVTPSSLSIVTMLPKTGESYFATGPAPKYQNSEVLHIQDAFSKIKQSKLKVRARKKSEKYIKGMRDLMLAQKYFDLNDFKETYHKLQMAIDSLKGYPEYYIANFYFLALQYCEESHAQIRAQILQDFINIKENLPSHLQDHCLLFIARLERALSGDTDVSEDLIADTYLKNVLKREKAIPTYILNKTIKPLINLRIDLLDIIYAHGWRQ